MVECMFIWPHIISRFTCVNVVYIYELSEISKNPKIYHPVKVPFYSTLVDLRLPTYLGICFYKFFGFVNISIFTSS